MPEAVGGRSPWRLVAVPAVITLAVTLLRLTGELLRWSPALFNRNVGGGGALVGISWLVPIFGVYFGLKLAGAGQGPQRVGRGVALVLLAIVALPVLFFAAAAVGISEEDRRMPVVFVVASAISVWLGMRAWPALGRTLLAYALAARVPVMVVMLFAILGSWGTHYDAASPGLAALGPLPKWLLIGVLPQMTVWIAYTVAIGALFGLVTGAVVVRRRRPAIA